MPQVYISGIVSRAAQTCLSRDWQETASKEANILLMCVFSGEWGRCNAESQ